MTEDIRINSRAELARLAKRLGTRPDWHEPDEQGLTARVLGEDFDNAGFWGHYKGELNAYGEGRQELWVEISRDGNPVAEINLATLLAWAAESTPAEVPAAEPAVKHRHKFQGQSLVHSHRGGGVRHGYFGHPEDIKCEGFDLPGDEWDLVL